MKNKVTLEDCESVEIIEPVEICDPVPVKPVTPRNRKKTWAESANKKSEMMEIRHRHQIQLIDEQTKKLKLQNETIQALRTEKVI